MNRAKNLAFPLLALVATAVLTAIPASASDLAWNITAPDTWDSTYAGGNVADVFTVNSSEDLTSIGIPVVPNDGVYGDYLIAGIYDSSGNLLNPTSVTFDPQTAQVVDGYYWAMTGAVTLVAGQTYTVVVDNLGANYGYSSTAPAPGWANFDSSEFLGTYLTYQTTYPGPSNPAPDTFFDIELAGTTATPEPESLLLLGSGLIGLAGFLRFKLRKN